MKLVKENINKYLYGPSDEEVEKRLEKTDIDPDKLLRISVRKGYLKGVKKAIKQGANVIASKYEYFFSNISIAAREGYLDIVKCLTENGANIHIHTEYPLRLAIEKGHLNVVKYLVEQDANIYVLGNKLLQIAAMNGHTDVVNYLKSQMNKE